MEALLQALSNSGLAEFMRLSRWGYAGAATAHVLGIALLVGAIIPYNLRLLGLAQALPLDWLARLLPPVAIVGFALAVPSGSLLALTDPSGYLGFETFQAKLALIGLAVLSAGVARWRHGGDLRRAGTWQLRRVALLSLTLWLSVLVAGRLIAFVHG